MKRKDKLSAYIYGFVIILIMFSVCEAISSIDFPPNSSTNGIIKSSDQPFNAVIAVDSSASMYGTNASADAIEIVKSVARYNNTENKIGFASWRANVDTYGELSSDYTNIIKRMSAINYTGFTCFKIGLNRSIGILNNSSENKKNILIIISDGKENCNRNEIGNLTCEQAKQIIPPGVDVRTIYLGDSRNKSSLLSCLADGNEPIKPEEFKYKIIKGIQKEVPVVETARNSFYVNANGSVTKYQEQRTKVNITKIVEQGDYGGPRIRIRIETPEGPNVPNSLVIALDSSGSFDMGGNPEYGKQLREAMNPTLEGIKEKLPNSNISILSWNDKIDFAYDPMSNSDPMKADLVPIDKAVRDIKEKKVFTDDPLYLKIGDQELPFVISGNPYPRTYYKPSEDKSTDFTKGLGGALDILNKAYPNLSVDENNTVLKSIIFIAGRSEFVPFSRQPNLLEKAKKNKYHVYTLGIGVINGSLMEGELMNASKQTGGEYHYSSGGKSWTRNAIVDEISKIVEEIRDTTLADNISLVDTLYPYLKVVNSSIKATKISGGSAQSINVKPRLILNRDGTTTIELGINENLPRNTVLEISMDTKFDLSMPVDVSEQKRSLYTEIDDDSKISSVTFRWHTDRWYQMYLPENRISLS